MPMKPLVTAALIVSLLLGTLALYFHDQKKNPPGFYLDEASIAINAFSIAREGVDEYGTRMPFYFRAFGEYKNPVYIYLLAGVFKVAYPSVLVARRLSAFACWLGAVMLGLLAWRITRRRWITAVAFLLAILTPALFEIGRLVFEVALYPLVIALFLLTVYTAAQRVRWNAGVIAALVATLALVEYTYSAGRALAPLFALGVAVIFYKRDRRNAIVAMFGLFVLTSIVPVLVYNHRNDGALLARAKDTSFLGELKTKPEETLAALERNTINNILPIGMALRGDPNHRHHVPGGGGSMLGATLILAIAGAWLIVRTRPFDRWWLFVLFGTLVSIIPGAITNDVYHSLRLSSFIVFALVLSIRTLIAPAARPVVAIALVLGAIQPFWFFHAFHKYGVDRPGDFNVGMERMTDEALGRPERPIYVLGLDYCQAWWFGDINQVPRNQFARVDRREDVPPRSLFITHEDCPGCEELARDHWYSLQRTP
jgi:hypothetical protein